MENKDLDRRFVQDLKENTKPMMIAIGSIYSFENNLGDNNRIIPKPDKILMHDIALAYQGYIRRKEKQLKK